MIRRALRSLLALIVAKVVERLVQVDHVEVVVIEKDLMKDLADLPRPYPQDPVFPVPRPRGAQ